MANMNPAPTLATAPGTAEGLTGFEASAVHPSEAGGYHHTREQDALGNRVQVGDSDKDATDRDFNHHQGSHLKRQYDPPSAIMGGRTGVADEVPQQGSTQPGDGSEVRRTDGTAHGALHGPTSSREVPFKERVVGVAQVTRGTLLRKPSLKEHGEAILEGRTTHAEDKLKND